MSRDPDHLPTALRRRVTATRGRFTRLITALPDPWLACNCGSSAAPFGTDSCEACIEHDRARADIAAAEWAAMLPLYAEEHGDDAVRWMLNDGLRVPA